MAQIDEDAINLINVPDEKLDFKDFLRKRWQQYWLKNGGRVSQNDFARWLGISNSNLTNYMLGLRQPIPKFVEILADKLGDQVYDKLGMPRKLPRDKDILFIVDVLMNDATDQEKREFVERARNLREGRTTKTGKQAFS